MAGTVRRLGLAGLDVLLLSAAYLLAYWLRTGEDLSRSWGVIGRTLPILLAISLCVHLRLGLFNAILRYASMETAVAVLKAAGIAVPLSMLVFFLAFRLEGVPRTVFAIYAMAAILFVGGSRLAVRWWFSRRAEAKQGRRVLLYGAGYLGTSVLRALRESRSHDEVPVGFLDDDPLKKGREVQGVRVAGPAAAAAEAARSLDAEEVWVCVRDLPGDRMRALLSAASSSSLAVKVVPRSNGKLDPREPWVAQPPRVEDLLRRPPRKLDRERMREWVRGQRVLVTGAGGSIGSELSRQVAGLGPDRLVVCDASELNLFNIDGELRPKFGSILSKPYLVNVCDEAKVKAMFADERPTIVFHAAAYKHVPLVEANPCEGIVNNVKGTLAAAQAARAFGVRDFVFISTDKAVRPANVMGATKRLGELICRTLDQEGPTNFMAVRFGNVLGSSGSVVQVFQEQIRRGGPVTVTHPEMTRYFMLISEAVELVIQAGSIGKGGEVFLLDMGEPVRIADLAREMVRLMGKEGVQVVVTGVRPGEKIHEELSVTKLLRPTGFPDLAMEQEPGHALRWEALETRIAALLSPASAGRADQALAKLRESIQPTGDSERSLPAAANRS